MFAIYRYENNHPVVLATRDELEGIDGAAQVAFDLDADYMWCPLGVESVFGKQS